VLADIFNPDWILINSLEGIPMLQIGDHSLILALLVYAIADKVSVEKGNFVNMLKNSNQQLILMNKPKKKQGVFGVISFL
jgi:hypothetical protein